MMRIIRTTALTGTALVLALSGCSGSSQPQAGTSPSAPVVSGTPGAQPSGSAPASAAPSGSSAPAGSTGSTPSAVTTAVAAPGGGSVKDKVAPVTVATPAPKPITATVQPVSGVDVSIKPAAVTLKATVPGDVSGPGVAITVTIKNGSDKALPIGDTVVNLTDASGNPAAMFVGAPAKPMTGELAPGKSATGVYAFRIDEKQRGKVRVEVRGNPVMGIAVYEGRA